MDLNSQNVARVMNACITDASERLQLKKEADYRSMKEVMGVVHKFYFLKDKIEEHREEIKALLNELPDQFKKQLGGGWSFLQACNRKDGIQWTGLHLQMECLFCLGMAAGYVEELTLIPREALPGGMPYYMIDLEVKEDANCEK